MLFLIESKAEDLANKAKKELRTVGDAAPSREKNAEKKQDIRNMIRRARVTVKDGAAPGTYEIRNDIFKEAGPDLLLSDDPDVEVGNVEPRTRASVRAELTHELRDLVMRGASEMEVYEAHAEEAAKQYKQALERRKGRVGSTSMSSGPSTGRPPRGILVNKNGERPADKEPKRKKATFET